MNPLIKCAITAAILLPIVLTLILFWPTTTDGPRPLPTDHQGPPHPPALTEYGDFQCPYCASFAEHAVPALHEDFVQQGLLTYEYRHLPILGPTSVAAAEASECARDQEAFNRYHDALFQIIHSNRDNPPLTPNNLIEIAQLLDLDADRFAQCLIGRQHEQTIKNHANTARSLGARGTPSLFIDGHPLPWKDYPDLNSKIRQYINLHSDLHH